NRHGRNLVAPARTEVRHPNDAVCEPASHTRHGDIPMAFSRRSFLRWAASVSTLAVASPRGAGFLQLRAAESDGFRPAFLPSEKEVWDQLVWMAKLGPKYTGNEAHTKFVEFLATEMKSLGLEVSREHYTFPRWDAKRTALGVTPKGGSKTAIPVTSYFPYSG